MLGAATAANKPTAAFRENCMVCWARSLDDICMALLAGAGSGQYPRLAIVRIACRSADDSVKQAGKPVLSNRAARPNANDNFLLASALASPDQSPLLALCKRVADCGCNVAEALVAALGAELSVQVLAQGPWDAIAKLETALAKLDRNGEMRLVQFRTNAKQQQSSCLPYIVEVIASDKAGILFQLAEFFANRNISIEQLHSTRYQAMQTGADMFSAQITIGIPSTMHLAALRDDFLEFCDGLNLDAIMDPMKF